MSITIQAKDFNGNKCEASVGDILFGAFFIDTSFQDGPFSPVVFKDDAAEWEAYEAEREAEEWSRDCAAINAAERNARDYRAWMADDSHLYEQRI